jgi:hypothetical protein
MIWLARLPFIPPLPPLPLEGQRTALPQRVRVGVLPSASRITKMVRPSLPIDVRRLGIKAIVVLEVKVNLSPARRPRTSDSKRLR